MYFLRFGIGFIRFNLLINNSISLETYFTPLNNVTKMSQFPKDKFVTFTKKPRGLPMFHHHAFLFSLLSHILFLW